MNEFAADDSLSGRLARAVNAVRDEVVPVVPLERSLSRARALEPRAAKDGSGSKKEIWRNRISSLFDQLEDRDFLTAVPLCCVSPAEPPIISQSVEFGSLSSRERRGATALLAPATFSASGEVWEEALTGFWSEDEEVAVGADRADWIATSTACADWTWTG